MENLLMPKATALWLIHHTKLTFAQIAQFCGFHELQVNALANDDKGTLQEMSPLVTGQLTEEEIKRCEADPTATLSLQTQGIETRKKKRRYTPLSKRADIPHTVLWLIKNFPQLTDPQICSLLGTTKNTVKSIREGTRYNIKELSPRDPVLLGLCTAEEIQACLQEPSS